MDAPTALLSVIWRDQRLGDAGGEILRRFAIRLDDEDDEDGWR